MTSLAYAAAAAIGARLGELTPGIAVQVVAAPPTLDGAYPAMAFEYLGRPRIETSGDIEIQGADGRGLVVGDGAAVVEVAALRADARIWVGSRTPAQRERLQDLVLGLFYLDEFAPGRLLVDLSGAEVGGYQIPATLPVACTIRESEWVDEQVMGERRQGFLYVSLDVPILMLRAESWRVETMTAELAAAPDLTSSTAIDRVTVDEAGATTNAT